LRRCRAEPAHYISQSTSLSRYFLFYFKIWYEADSWAYGDAGPRADSARGEAPVTRDSVRRPSWVVTRIPLDGDTLVRIRRDSSFLLLRTSDRGTEITGMSPDVAEAGGRIATSLAGALAEAVGPLLPMLVIGSVAFFAPLLVPLAITLVWSAQRRRYGRD
jgi:hypothetical protein